MKGLKVWVLLPCSLALVQLSGCMSKPAFEKQLRQSLKDDPAILTDAIEAHPAEVLASIETAAQKARADLAAKRAKAEKELMDAYFEHPYQPLIRKDEAIRGRKDAPIVLVEYADFQCPYCGRAFATVKALREKYGDEMQFIFKQLPLDMHPQAMIAAEYYEAIRLQNPKAAFRFYDLLFTNQSKLARGKPFLDQTAKGLGVDMDQLARDFNAPAVKQRIGEDKQEAARFGMNGTPGFLVNGIPVRGAYPASHFIGIIDELEKRGKLELHHTVKANAGHPG